MVNDWSSSTEIERDGVEYPNYLHADDEYALFLGETSWKYTYSDKALPNLNFSVRGEKVRKTTDYLYSVDGSTIERVSLTDFSFMSVEIPIQYEVYNISVTASDIIKFNGLRYSDGAIVDGTIDINGNIEILNEDLEVIITSVFPLN